jgi:competence protein ComEC
MDRPIVWITIAFSLGIIIGKYVSPPFWLIFLFFLSFFILSMIAYAKKLNLSAFILVLCFLAGMLSFQIKNLPSSDDISNYAGKGYLSVIGYIDDEPKVREENLLFPLKIEKAIKGKAENRAAGTIYVSVQEEEPDLNYGDKIEVRGVLSEFQSFSNPLMPEGVKGNNLHATFYEKLPGGRGNPFKEVALWFSQKFNEVLLKILPQKDASLLGSILLGNAVSPLPQDMKDTYRKAGLIHLLVVSGTQVSILIGVCLAITLSIGLPLWSAVAVTSFFNLMLIIITGAGASILRAAIMGEITLIGLIFERKKDFYTALSLSALILLIFDPTTLFDIGFQLSFAATWALVYIAPVLEKKMPQLLAISLAPIMATSPIIAFSFSQVSPGAIISNLLVLPWVEFLVILGISTTLLGFIFLPLAQILGNTIWLMLTALENIANWVASLPGACFYIKAPSFALVAGYYVGLVILLEILRKDERIKFTRKRIAFALLLFSAVFLWDQALSLAPIGDKELVVTFLDVGQGDAALIEVPNGQKILIDGGGVDRSEDNRVSGDRGIRDKIGEKVVVPFLHRKGINHLDLVVLTHPHADHLGGLNVVLEDIKVDQVLDNGQAYDSQAYRRFKSLIEANRIKYSAARVGAVINLADDLKIHILNPVFPFLQDTNSDSIVMRLVYGDISFLFTGDLEKEGEERVLPSVRSSTVLKVGHHGSSTSTSDEFLRAVNPQVAVISVGKRNRYRHPSSSTMQRLLAAGVKVYRTDENGAVTVRTDGKSYAIEMQRRRCPCSRIR